MTIGHAGKSGIRISDKAESQTLFDAFFGYGYKEIDTARMYGEGTTEEVCHRNRFDGHSVMSRRFSRN
jgi:aflatoxin B1 aldehyde reductase